MLLSNRPLASITLKDIQSLFGESESDTLEFKRQLAENPKRAGWAPPNSYELQQDAKDDLVKEVIAFANAHGGDLILGLTQSKTEPPRAENIFEISECAELAKRLQQAISDTVEPRLERLTVAGIANPETGSGVVVIRSPKSRHAPHRNARTREAYFRRGENSVPMSMREIQDLTMLRSIESARFGHRMTELKNFVTAEIGSMRSTGERNGICITAAPLSEPLELGRVYGQPSLRPRLGAVRVKSDKDWIDLTVGNGHLEQKPTLRGSVGRSADNSVATVIGVFSDGGIAFGIEYPLTPNFGNGIFRTTIVATFVNVLAMIQRIRGAAQVAVEYGLQPALYAEGAKLRVIRTSGEVLKTFTRPPLPFPLYPIGPFETFDATCTEFSLDLWNLVEKHDQSHELKVAWDQVLRQ